MEGGSEETSEPRLLQGVDLSHHVVAGDVEGPFVVLARAVEVAVQLVLVAEDEVVVDQQVLPDGSTICAAVDFSSRRRALSAPLNASCVLTRPGSRNFIQMRVLSIRAPMSFSSTSLKLAAVSRSSCDRWVRTVMTAPPRRPSTAPPRPMSAPTISQTWWLPARDVCTMRSGHPLMCA